MKDTEMEDETEETSENYGIAPEAESTVPENVEKEIVEEENTMEEEDNREEEEDVKSQRWQIRWNL